MSINERNKGKKYWEKFGYRITKNSRGTILIDKKNINTF